MLEINITGKDEFLAIIGEEFEPGILSSLKRLVFLQTYTKEGDNEVQFAHSFAVIRRTGELYLQVTFFTEDKRETEELVLALKEKKYHVIAGTINDVVTVKEPVRLRVERHG